VFRFTPHRLGAGELARVHGHDERISAENLARGLAFYSALLRPL